MHDYDLICIGSGPAGEKAATQAAYFGRRVAIIERNAQPGGAMVNTGTIPSKALRETALLCSAFSRRPLPGMQFNIDRSVSVARFMARRLYIEQQEHDRIERSMDRHNIDVHRGVGRIVDPHTVEIDHPDGTRARFSAAYILIATGSAPVRPANIPFDDLNIVDADSILTIDRLADSMLIIGGGVIGCEYASIFAEMHVKVTLVHRNPPIMPFIDDDCRERLLKTMTERGVQFVYDCAVSSAAIESDSSVTLRLDTGESLHADKLLWAAGRAPNTSDLGLDSVHVAVTDRGQITVDDKYQTNVPSIFAAGDVIGFPALAATSMEQGRIAVCNMFNIDFKASLARTMPIGIYTIPAVSMVGISETEAHEKKLDIIIGFAPYANNARGRMLGDENGLVKCIFDRDTGALLGASIVGEDATELIHIAMDAITNHTGIEHFINACYNYPSLTELYKYAAYSALQALNSSATNSNNQAA